MSVNIQTIRRSVAGGRQLAGQILIYIAGLGLLAAAIAKFAHLPPVVAQLTNAGFGGEKITLVASLELLSALLFLLPVTRSIGVPFASAFLGGAIAAHVRAGEFAGALWPALFMSVCWMGAWLRYPEVLWSLSHRGQKDR
jgi:hypothetical protein